MCTIMKLEYEAPYMMTLALGLTLKVVLKVQFNQPTDAV